MKVRDMERLAIAEMNGDSPLAFVGMPAELADSVIRDADLRGHLIRDAHARTVRHMRIMR